MDFEIPAELSAYLDELDAFIEREIKPLEAENDNIRFFDHRREDARTDWDRGGLPNEEWEALLAEARRRADAAGHFEQGQRDRCPELGNQEKKSQIHKGMFRGHRGPRHILEDR